MTRLNQLDLSQPVSIEPMRTFPSIRDLVTDVSWNFRAKKTIAKFSPRPADAPDGTWRLQQVEAERVQEFRKCIECFLCQDVCHVLREHHLFDHFVGPRHLVYTAALEMNPIDREQRAGDLKRKHGIGFCNITKCCTKVCPESIGITDNAAIPLKERVIDQLYDPVAKIFRMIRPNGHS
jgi:succinate dehydrogenase / fumarate reductase iron-sulfur subunit